MMMISVWINDYYSGDNPIGSADLADGTCCLSCNKLICKGDVIMDNSVSDTRHFKCDDPQMEH